jgi:hypothetical protein
MRFEPVILPLPQRKVLNDIIDRGSEASPRVFLSRALLWLERSPDGPALDDLRVGETLRLSLQSVKEIKTLFSQNGLEAALAYKPPPRNGNFRWHKDKHAIEENFWPWPAPRLLTAETAGRRAFWPRRR